MNSEAGSIGTGTRPSPARRTQRLVILAVGLTCMIVACEPVRHYRRLQVAEFAGSAPRKPYGTVKVFQTAEDVKRPYEVTGIMSCEGSAGEEAAILKAMLYRAADMGADGIVLNAPRVGGEDLTGNQVDVRVGWGAFAGNRNQRAYRAQTIRFKE